MVAVTAPCEPMPPGPSPDPAAEVEAWAASGAMWLTGPADAAPLGPPSGLVPKLRAIAAFLADRAAALGGRLEVDPLAMLGHRAAVAGLRRQGTTSCGGATRLLPARDGWLAVSLARPSDVELVPAWFEITGRHVPATGIATEEVWGTVAAQVAASPVGPILDRALLLGLAAAALPGTPPVPVVAPAPLAPLPVRATAVAGDCGLIVDTARPDGSAATLAGLLVVDLSSLWAGPLAGALLAAAGATVVKVESTGRPDGARSGPPAFFDLLNGHKRSVALDLGDPGDVRVLRRLLARADVVVEASRPRALEHLGIDALGLLAAGGPRVWVSITGHGRAGRARDRVGFGDDAAVAGGLVCRLGDRPVFCADAVADPASGMVAAAAALGALAAGGPWLVDVAMSGVAAHLAGPTLPAGDAPPRAVPPSARPSAWPVAAHVPAPPLGEHTRSVLAGLGLSR